jgi:hypothetical protein
VSEIADLLDDALTAANRVGVRFVRGSHVDEGLLNRIAELTYDHVREHAYLLDEGETVSDASILGWWTEESHLTDERARALPIEPNPGVGGR